MGYPTIQLVLNHVHQERERRVAHVDHVHAGNDRHGVDVATGELNSLLRSHQNHQQVFLH